LLGNMGMEERDLDALFSRYRAACPDVDASPNFMPELWARIEDRAGGFWTAFERLSRVALAICAMACLVLLLLDVHVSSRSSGVNSSYVDALASEQNSEATYYAEAVRSLAPASADTARE
jgi:hypothetical protein